MSTQNRTGGGGRNQKKSNVNSGGGGGGDTTVSNKKSDVSKPEKEKTQPKVYNKIDDRTELRLI